jgi:hypothetical protein
VGDTYSRKDRKKMAMDLNVECHHCHAPIGIPCTEECPVNGSKIAHLRTALAQLGMNLESVNIFRVHSPRNNKIRHRVRD